MSLFGMYKGEDVVLYHENGDFDTYREHKIFNIVLAPNNMLYAEITKPCGRTRQIDATIMAPYCKVEERTKMREYVIVCVCMDGRDVQFVFEKDTLPWSEEVPLGLQTLLQDSERNCCQLTKLPISVQPENINDNINYIEKAAKQLRGSQRQVALYQ